ncbi:MAG: IS1380 family transposase [Polyangiaceae bacterium]|nr:IS1380 family transposase [Polyangiaceae bacterium]
MKSKKKRAVDSEKVRRDRLGGKRGGGNRRSARIRRPRASAICAGRPDPTLTGVAGLVPFGVYLEKIGLDAQLRATFFEMKDGPTVIYPMEAQLRMLIDANVVGEQRVFGLEALASDPLFVELAGGVVPSIDTAYRGLARFDDEPMKLAQLEIMMASHGLATLEARTWHSLHIDIDTTVETTHGHQQGAVVGYNPRYPGRNSYHPLLAVIAETGACIGAQLRPGDEGIGNDQAPLIARYVSRLVGHAPKNIPVWARIDSAGDCAKILEALDGTGAYFVTKARLTPDLFGTLLLASGWKSVDEDADGEPLVQVCDLAFRRNEWSKDYRVVAVRRRDRDTGKQVQLWEHLDYGVQVFISNNSDLPAEDIAHEYDGRAEIEPRIAELKNAIGIGKIPTQSFDANHAVFLLKLLTHNLVRRYTAERAPRVMSWRMPWISRALFRVPGRLTRSGRQRHLHVHPKSLLQEMLC